MNEQKPDLKVLWLPAWYPSRVDFLPGDFTDRHAAAVSRFASVSVLYVTKDPALAKGKKVVEIAHLGEHRIYRAYYNSPAGLGFLGKIWSSALYYRLLLKLYQMAKKESIKFHLAHVHISLRQGLFAQWLKRTTGLPYVITEQNSWFMPIANKRYTDSPILQKIISSNFRYANAVHVVSRSLGHQLRLKFPFIKKFTVIPNVVDTNLFQPLLEASASSSINFFTVTSDVYHKNTDGVLRAFGGFLPHRKEAVLHIAGPNIEGLRVLADELCIEHAVKFYGPVGYVEIARHMQQADALIFFTRYETFGCVMAEALCCGTPVIASKIPVLEENLVEFENALFVSAGDEEVLRKKMIQFAITKSEFDNSKIAADARQKFNYENIGTQFYNFYRQVLTKAHASS